MTDSGDQSKKPPTTISPLTTFRELDVICIPQRLSRTEVARSRLKSQMARIARVFKKRCRRGWVLRELIDHQQHTIRRADMELSFDRLAQNFVATIYAHDDAGSHRSPVSDFSGHRVNHDEFRQTAA